MAHADFITHGTFSPDGARVASASADKTARIWDTSTGTAVTAPIQHDERVVHIAFDPRGNRIVTVCEDRSARVWDARTGKPLTPAMRHVGEVLFAVFSPDGNRIATSVDNSEKQWWEVQLWDATTGAELGKPLPHDGRIQSIFWSSDGTKLASASGRARVWDTVRCEPLTPPIKHDNVISQVELSPDGSMLATACADGSARIWDAKSGNPSAPPIRYGSDVTVVGFSPDSSKLIAACFNGWAQISQTKNGAAVSPLMYHQGIIGEAAFSRDGRMVITVGNGWARVWDLTIGLPLGAATARAESDGYSQLTRTGRRLFAARALFKPSGDSAIPAQRALASSRRPIVSYDGMRLVTGGRYDPVRVWDTKSGIAVSPPIPDELEPVHADFSPDGGMVIIASVEAAPQVLRSRRGFVRIVDAQTGVELRKQALAAHYACYSPDSNRIVTADLEGVVRVWDWKTFEPLSAPMKHDSFVRSAAFNHDATMIVTTTDSSVRRWDALTGEPLTSSIKVSKASQADFSLDGSKIVASVHSGPSVSWDLPVNLRSHQDLMARAELLSSRKVDVTGAIVNLTNKEWQQRWVALQGEMPNEFKPSPRTTQPTTRP
jgi:WD40 repeat protein